MDINDFIKLLDGVKRSSSGYVARCPAHDDHNQSLSLSEGEDGRILVKCHAGCGVQKVVGVMGLKMRDLFPQREGARHQKQKGSIVATYDYIDADGQLRYQVVRYQPKDFRQRRPDGKGSWIYNLKGVTPILYKLPEVLQADIVWIVEGEKDADNMHRLGFIATCCSSGAGKWRSEHSSCLKDRHAIIIPDNDKPGKDHAEVVAQSLCGVAKSVRILDLCELLDMPDKGDVSDYINMCRHEYGEAWQEITKHLLEHAAKTAAPIERKEKLLSRIDYPHTDIGAGEMFVDAYKDCVRYVAQQGDYYVWDGRHWAKDDINHIQELGKELVRVSMPEMAKVINDDDQRASWLKWAMQLQANKRRNDMLTAAQSSPAISARLYDFDTQQRYFNMSNGVLDLQTMQLLPHDKRLMLSHISPVVYKKDVVCARWNQFVVEIMDGDEAAARFLQKTVGYALAGDPKEDCMFILYGEKTRNGKSTFVKAMQRVFGDYGKTANPESLALTQLKNGGGPSSDIARLKGARFVSMSEPDKNLKLDAALVKKLTGRDTLTARFMHREFFEFQPQFVIFMNTNHLPYIADMTLFTSGRIFCIPFPVSFKGHEDRSLSDQFAEPDAMSAILNWCLEGYKLYTDEGLTGNVAATIQDATLEYEHDSDTLGQFLEECILPCPNDWIASRSIYKVYSGWTVNNGYRPLGTKTLTQEMKKRGYQQKRKGSGMGFSDIILKSDIPFSDNSP